MGVLSHLGQYQGTVEADKNLIDVFKQREIERHENSFLKFSPLVIKKLGIRCEQGTMVEINGDSITINSGVFELGFEVMDVTSLVFPSATEVDIIYGY